MRRALAGVVLAASAVLAGCQSAPGTAAVIDGQRYSEEDLAESVRIYQEMTGQPVGADVLISTAAIEGPAEDVASDLDHQVSEAQVVETMDQTFAMRDAQPPEGEYPDLLISAIRASELLRPVNEANQMGNPEPYNAVVEGIEDVDVEVNPRYGTWMQSGVVPTQHDWLAVTNPESNNLQQP